MKEIIFAKTQFSYEATIDTDQIDNPRMDLDTGSPITVISIPVLLKLTRESLFSLRTKISAFINNHKSLTYGVYGSQMSSISHSFVPYLIKDVSISGAKFPYFMFWLDITHYTSDSIRPTSTLLGFDYVKQGKKYFDEDDNFHIQFESLTFDTSLVRYSLSNIKDGVHEINSLIDACNPDKRNIASP